MATRREEAALYIAARLRVYFKDGYWSVPSSQKGNPPYKVYLSQQGNTCNCDDYTLRRADCKHILAALLVAAREKVPDAPEPPDIDSIPAPKKPTYKQDWPNYNLAKTNERRHLMSLLADLSATIPEPARDQTKPGPKPITRADAVYCAVFKVYSLLSARRFNGHLEDALEKGYIARVPHFNTVLNCLEDPALTPILTELVTLSSLPLRAIETDFAFDSSGFSVSRFVRWTDEKYGERSSRDFVKCHIACGVRTNVVTAIRILDRDAADSPQFKPLLETTAKNFTVKEASGDKAYSSVDNVEAVDALGGFPALAFKITATGGAGGAFERLFYFYSFHREEFLSIYHKRSNIESTFSMVKRTLGDAVKAKTDTAMKNEVLAKFVAHNIMCLIASWYELGIEPIFATDPQEENNPDILPMVRRGG